MNAKDLLDKLLHMPLYEWVQLSTVERDANEVVKTLRTWMMKFDAHCPECVKGTTWTLVVSQEMQRRQQLEKATPVEGTGSRIGSFRAPTYLEDFELRADCSRNQQHQMRLYVRVEGPEVSTLLQHRMNKTENTTPWSLVKVGQWPSLTDFQRGDLSEFEDGLTKQQRTDFVRAINTAAHGFNVAACVYYRRVFESILIEARDQHVADTGMTEWSEFRDARGMDERIRLLRDNLPRFMSEHPHLYSVLSIGVHELSEEQCAAELPMLRKAIELIVRDRMAEMHAKRDREDLSRLLAQSVDRHK